MIIFKFLGLVYFFWLSNCQIQDKDTYVQIQDTYVQIQDKDTYVQIQDTYVQIQDKDTYVQIQDTYVQNEKYDYDNDSRKLLESSSSKGLLIIPGLGRVDRLNTVIYNIELLVLGRCCVI
jgi:DNA-binding beta-propeller fold protein YncE